MEKVNKDKNSFELRVLLQRIGTTVFLLESSVRIERYLEDSDSDRERAMYYIFATDVFCDRMAEILSEVPFGSYEAMAAAKFLKSREWNSRFDYFLVREGDLPQSNIWKIVGDILVAVVSNHNLHRSPKSELYLKYPATWAYATRGLDGVFRLELFDTDDEVIKDLAKKGDSWYATHDTLKEMSLYAPYDESKFMGISEYNFNDEAKNIAKAVVAMGEFRRCKYCGENIYFANIQPEIIFGLWRRKFLKFEE